MGSAPVQPRLVSLDGLRGLTVAGMVLVNNPGTWSAIYAPLRHAAWHGWTPTDMVFPFFVFIVGVAIPFSFAKRKLTESRGELFLHVWARALSLILIGLLILLPVIGAQLGLNLDVISAILRTLTGYVLGAVLFLTCNT